jgi:prepilin-type N-terminal cleavage/methylation domain-containing protein
MKHRRGFTLIELIVVVVLVGVLMAIVVPRILSSTDDANAKLIAKSVKDVRDAVAMAKMKCLSELSAVGAAGTPDTGQLLQALASTNCQILPQNAYEVDAQNWAKVKDFKFRTDFRNSNNDLVVEIDCNGNDSICGKVRTQLNEIYGGSACPNAPTGGILTCTLYL